jgi:hypothetical protein
MNKRVGGLWRFLTVAMLLCAFMTVVWSDRVAYADDTTLTVSAATGTYGGTVNLSARLISGGSNVSGVNISFTLHNVFVGNATTNSTTGVATLTNVSLSGISAGTYSNYSSGIRANFSGYGSYNASGGTATLTINKASQTISFTEDHNPPSSAVYGTSFNVTAVATSGIAVNYSSSGAASNSGGRYNMTSGTGNATVIVNQGGNTNYSAAPALTANVTAVKASSSTALTSSANPSAYNQSVTFTANVSGHPGTATGNVTFMEGSTIIAANVTMSSGRATFTISNFTVASHAITAFYNGDANFNSSTSSALNQTVNKANTTISVNASPNQSTHGQLVTFTAIVTGAGASGTVTFMDGAAAMGNTTLSAGTATFNLSTLPAGNHSITAVYSGDSHFLSNTSETLIQTVKASINWGLIGGLMAAGIVIIITLVVTLVIALRRHKS